MQVDENFVKVVIVKVIALLGENIGVVIAERSNNTDMTPMTGLISHIMSGNDIIITTTKDIIDTVNLFTAKGVVGVPTRSLDIAEMQEGQTILQSKKNIGTDLLFGVLDGLIIERSTPHGIHIEGKAEENSRWMPQKIMSIKMS